MEQGPERQGRASHTKVFRGYATFPQMTSGNAERSIHRVSEGNDYNEIQLNPWTLAG